MNYNTDYPYISYNDQIYEFDEYINFINQNSFYAGELELKVTSQIFNINILVLKYIDKYKGYIKQLSFINDEKIKPIMFLEFVGNNNGHYNLIHIKNNIDVKNYKDKVPLVIDNKYNTDFLNICYRHKFNFLQNNIQKRNNINDNTNKNISNLMIKNKDSFTITKDNENKNSLLINDKQSLVDDIKKNS